MMQKPITVADKVQSKGLTASSFTGKARKKQDARLKAIIITLDSHLAAAVERAGINLAPDDISLELFAAVDWNRDKSYLDQTLAAIKTADLVLVNMMFMEDHINSVLDALKARRDDCDAMVATMSAGEVVKLTRMGRLSMDGEAKGPMALLKRLRGSRNKKSSGAGQMAMLRRIPKLLRFIPGTAQDLRTYFLSMQYWLSASDDNVANMIRMLASRYGKDDRAGYKESLTVKEPVIFPDVGLYHPDMKGRFTTNIKDIPCPKNCRGRIGLILMRSYLLARDTAHYDAVIKALEEKGFQVLPAFSSGLNSQPAIDAFFRKEGVTQIDALLSLTGFSLIGGPAYNDSEAASKLLSDLNIPYLAAHSLEFQTLEDWRSNGQGLTPIESTIMVAIPELDGATGPMVFGGRRKTDPEITSPDADRAENRPIRAMQPAKDRVEMLANRVEKLVLSHKKPRNERKLAIVIFNFPPGSGAVGTAAHLSVFRSLYNTLERLKSEGYTLTLPSGAEDLKNRLLKGNSAQFGTDTNVAMTIDLDTHITRQKWLPEIEAQWGAAPGRHQVMGSDLLVQGLDLGNVFIGVQPGFGFEGDPMKMLFDKGFAPTHAFAAFYTSLKQDFGADAVLHFGTHGALEFMPGAHVGMTDTCWPDRLIGDMPHLYFYAANNPSEGTLAKRRSAATLISYLTPSITEAGLYSGVADLKASLDRYRSEVLAQEQLEDMAALIKDQATALDIGFNAKASIGSVVESLLLKLHEFEKTLIPHGLHVIGEVPSRDERRDLLKAVAMQQLETSEEEAINLVATLFNPQAKISGKVMKERLDHLSKLNEALQSDGELEGLIKALDGGYIAPVSGGDILKSPEMLPTGRNIHGFDPFRLPSQFALKDGARQAELLLSTYQASGQDLPRSVAIVLWGTDNLKTEGGPIGQVLALVGAKPRFDSYGRLAGADLIPLADLGRPRVDVVMTVSGIFRDLLPLQCRMLAEALLKASKAEDEPADLNPIRANSLHYMSTEDIPLETAALRLFSNSEGTYGSNVNMLLDSGRWDDEDDLADTFTSRKCYAYGTNGKASAQAGLMKTMLRDVDMTYQNLESVDLGLTTIDHYFDTLGGISRAVRQAKGTSVPVYIGDQTTGSAKVRTLDQQVELETRTRMLNPKWVEGMLSHGYEGVRQIEASITNTLGWSATTGQVAPWVYQKLTENFVLNDDMRNRLASLNPAASAKLANRLIEAHERNYWTPDEQTLEHLTAAGEELEDRLEGIGEGEAA